MKSSHFFGLHCIAALHLISGFAFAQNVPALPLAPGNPLTNPAAAPQTQQPSKPAVLANQPSSGKNVIGFTAVPISDVLGAYYEVTGRRVLKDRGLENATVTIEVPGEFSDEEYRSIIEKGLLMHGYALVPSGPDLFKLVAAEQGTTPSTQGVPMILREDDLPNNDQVVSHVIQLNNIQADEASTAFQQLIPLHPYGKILSMANARALVITEASQTIRAYLDLAKQVDVKPMETVQKTIRLERSDASEIAEQLNSLLGLGSSGGTSGGSAVRSPPGQPPIPGGTPNGAVSGGTSSSLGGAGGATPESSKPVIQAITRTNSLIVIARPTDMQRIEALVLELDAESTSRSYFSRRLKYLDLTVFLGIAEKALLRNSKDKGQSGLPQQGANTAPTNTNNNAFGSNNSNSGFGSNSSLGNGGLGGGGLGGGSGSSFGSGSSTPLVVTKSPISVLIGNTLVIADPASSKFFASGPPEQVKALEELADELDVRPRQIMLSAIIGEFTLGDDFNFGLDWIQTLKQTGSDSLVGGVLNTQGTAFANPANLKDIAGFLAAGGPASIGGLTAYGQINRSLSVFLQTLEKTKRFHVLQKPSITALNHQSASIYIGQQIAIAGQTFANGAGGGIGGGLGFTSTTQYIPVRLQLDITPHIFNDSEVMLEFKQQNNDVSGFSTISGNKVPNISEQGMHNSLIVADQATAMLGGLITERDSNNKSGLPFLVRLPLLKYLFGSTNSSKERREMMIFVQPRIMPDATSHMLEQARMGDGNENYDKATQFENRPEALVPRALPAHEKPNDLLPPTSESDVKTKKGFFDKVKSLFQRKKPEQP